jgi:AraC-like DNA-binding protein
MIYAGSKENQEITISIDEIAALLLISPQSFCRYFKMKTRKTYFEFLVGIRIGHACRLLLNANIRLIDDLNRTLSLL